MGNKPTLSNGLDTSRVQRPYVHSGWSKLVIKGFRHIDDAFERHLRDIMRPAQIAFVQLMRATAGYPVGIELSNGAEKTQWAFILPNVQSYSNTDSWRVQFFDGSGFFSHTTHKTLHAAAEEALRGGYKIPDAGALDRCSQTKEWQQGVDITYLRDQLNQGLIHFHEYCSKVEELSCNREADEVAA